MKEFKNPIICALDTKNIADALAMCDKVSPHVGSIKLGLEFFTINGPQGISELQNSGVPIFLDLKFHDIPNTVAQAVRSAVRLNVDIITIHTLGGADMMKAAADAATDEAKKLNIQRPIIAGVTILTSMDDNDISEIGLNRETSEQVKILARLAKKSGLDGIVCSPHEIEIVKAECGADFKTIVPGIRPQTSSAGDQKRIMTPSEALKKGADFLVIGRPITKSADPTNAAEEIADSLR